MLFNSFDFIFFFLIVGSITLLLNYTHKLQARNAFLLLSSYIFYGSFNVCFLAILLFATLVTYIGGLYLGKVSNKKLLTGIVVILSLLPLVTFKYSYFLFHDVLRMSSSVSDWTADLILPIGISFFTFQALTYTIDLYRGKVECCRNLVDYSLFVAFFPTVLSGPIEKARNLMPQLKNTQCISLNDVMTGVGFFAWGLFKKIVVADRLSQYVDWAYSSSEYVSGGTLALASVFYSIQIYCDFSGYSDMAIGIARCLGIRLSNNFSFPYFSTKIKDFWRKWHISLTSWFTEYVYFSLGGNRVKMKIRWIFNISMVFLLSGIWHGAAWNFLLWGIIHAVLYLSEYAVGLHKKGHCYKSLLQKTIAGCCVFLLVSLAWMFFRIEDLSKIFEVLSKIASASLFNIMPGASTVTFAINVLLLVLLGICEVFLYRNRENGDAVISRTPVVMCGWVCSLLLMIALFGQSNDSFVYFQF
jgi:alginate O-acetyltransferase complex protein AlgI